MDVRRIVRQVQEQGDTLERAVLLEIACEESTCLQVDTHSSENNREVVLVVIVDTLSGSLHEGSLTTNLGSNFVVGKTGGGEDGNLLATGCFSSAKSVEVRV